MNLTDLEFEISHLTKTLENSFEALIEILKDKKDSLDKIAENLDTLNDTLKERENSLDSIYENLDALNGTLKEIKKVVRDHI